MIYVVDKNTRKFKTCFPDENTYKLQENEVIVTTEWVNGLYEPTYDFDNECWINGVSQEELENIQIESQKQQFRALRKMFFTQLADPISKREKVLRTYPKEQREELKNKYFTWYEQWLNAPESLEIPTSPEWLQPLFHKEVESIQEYQQILEKINS